MHAEYLVFNLVILVPVLVLSFFPPFFVQHWRAAWSAVTCAAVPFIVWDALVVGRHWSFNPRFVTGFALVGLPIEEILFFFTMPFACLFSWRALFAPRGGDAPRPELRALYVPALALLPIGGWLFVARGREYTGLALGAFAIAAAIDLGTGAMVLTRASFQKLTVFVIALTTVFNGYLTARPVVLYDDRYRIGPRVFTIPVEDYVYGLSLVLLTAVLFQRSLDADARRRQPRRSWIARRIEARLGGYRQAVVTPDPSRPKDLAAPRRVAVVGSGIAGMTAASVLSDRGFEVTLFERNRYLGGKIGSWPFTLADGTETHVSHGFHAFFRQYYNLRRWLDRIGASGGLVAIDDYVILGRDGERLAFEGTATTPLLNLVSLAGKGFFRLRDALLRPGMHELEAMLRYDAGRTFERFDDVSFAAFADRAGLPPRLRLAFNTFSRAFFAEEDRMSMAELIKGFHFYYLSNDAGLLYDYPDDDFDAALLQPARRYLEGRGVSIQLDAPVPAITRAEGGQLQVRGQLFEHVILAADVKGTRAILGAEGSVGREAPAFMAKVDRLRPSQRYAVLRVWMDQDLRADLPVFVCTDRRVLLDAVTMVHRAERASQAWVAKNGGAVIELHSYAVPDRVVDDAEVGRLLLGEMLELFPELAGARVLSEHLYVRDDFPAFHVGMAAQRPEVETPVAGLLLAGDWVKLPYPSMLMEAACIAGLLSANAILRTHGLREEAVFSVPAKGILAGLPERPWAHLQDPGRGSRTEGDPPST